MRPNPLAIAETVFGRIGQIAATPFRFLAALLVRIYQSLQVHPVTYARVSRALAGGVLAGLGVFIAVTIVGNIALLQSAKMLGGFEWSWAEFFTIIVLSALVGGLVGFGLLKMQANLLRGILAGLAGFALTASIVMVLRWATGYQPWAGGTMFMLTAFPVAFAGIWGMGGFETKNLTIEANLAARGEPQPEPVNLGAFDGVKFHVRLFSFLANRIWPVIKPLLGPAVVVTVLVGSVISILVLLGQIAPGTRTQTVEVDAAATTVAGTASFIGLQLPKFLVFLIVAVIILGGVATTALILALIFNALSNAVSKAKKDPKHPVDLTDSSGQASAAGRMFQWVRRLIQFNVDFAADIINAIGGMFGIRSAR
jgi:hypothetical protein